MSVVKTMPGVGCSQCGICVVRIGRGAQQSVGDGEQSGGRLPSAGLGFGVVRCEEGTPVSHRYYEQQSVRAR